MPNEIEGKEGKRLMKFFFTYGNDPKYPYGGGGWTEVYADSSQRAIIAFLNFHPNRINLSTVNCEAFYSEKQWKRMRMAEENSNYGHACRERIYVTVTQETFLSKDEVVFIIEHASYSRTIIDDT